MLTCIISITVSLHYLTLCFIQNILKRQGTVKSKQYLCFLIPVLLITLELGIPISSRPTSKVCTRFCPLDGINKLDV